MLDGIQLIQTSRQPSQHLENVSHARNHCIYLACPTHGDYYCACGRGGGAYSRVLEGDDFL